MPQRHQTAPDWIGLRRAVSALAITGVHLHRDQPAARRHAHDATDLHSISPDGASSA